MEDKHNRAVTIFLIIVIVLLIAGLGVMTYFVINLNNKVLELASSTNNQSSVQNTSNINNKTTDSNENNSNKVENSVKQLNMSPEEVYEKLGGAKMLQSLIHSKENNNVFNNGQFIANEMIFPIKVYMSINRISCITKTDEEYNEYYDLNKFQNASNKLFGKNVDIQNLSGATIINDNEFKMHASAYNFGVEVYDFKNIINNNDGTYTLQFNLINYSNVDGKIAKNVNDILASYDLNFSVIDDSIVVNALDRTYKK